MATSCRRSINTTINQRANIRRYEWAKVEVFRVPLKAPTCSPTLVCGRQLADRKPPPYVIYILRIYVFLSTLTSTFRPDSREFFPQRPSRQSFAFVFTAQRVQCSHCTSIFIAVCLLALSPFRQGNTTHKKEGTRLKKM